MKLGLSSPLEHKTPEKWAENMQKIGCQAVNFPVDYTAPKEVIQAYEQAAKDQGLVIAEVGAWCNPISTDPEIRENARIRCREQLRLADRLGACCCVNVSGSKGARWDGPYKENLTKETWKDMVKSIQNIIDEADPQNTFYTIEPMPWMYPMGPDEYVKLIEDVDRKHFAVHMDVFNWIISPERYFYHEEFMEECFEKLGKYIKSCHLKDVLLRQEFTLQLQETACGKGGINLKKYKELIDSVNPDMPVILEHLGSDQEYLDSLKFIKEYYQ